MESSSITSRLMNNSLPSTGQACNSELSPGTLPSFSAFRNAGTPSSEVNLPSSSTAIPIHSVPQVSETAFYTSAIAQPPVLRSQLTTSDPQAQQLSSHSYQQLSASSNQSVIEGHLVYPSSNPSSHQQQSYVATAQQQQQHNAQSFNHAIIYVNKVKVRDSLLCSFLRIVFKQTLRFTDVSWKYCNGTNANKRTRIVVVASRPKCRYIKKWPSCFTVMKTFSKNSVNSYLNQQVWPRTR